MKSKEINSYIKKSAEFSKPILEHLRQLVHDTCPEAQEKMKWSFPHFDYRGKMMCSMAAFKQHCAFGFWKAKLMVNSQKLFAKYGKTAMGNLGKICSLKDLPPDKILRASIKEAMKLNEEGVKVIKPKSAHKGEIKVPEYLLSELKKNKKAYVTFNSFSPAHRREYVEWITEAKTETTRKKRLDTAIEWMKDGKSRNWKYTAKKSN
ncbi:MAG TPA: YdeI/OmpD-associated family protein [Ignavibacteria bacterium]|nr:YdeI/OmpD-associated family protein [Ignavibacteria bacterium]